MTLNIERCRSLPLLLKIAGTILRSTPYFRGKIRFRRLIGKGVRGKGYSTIISFDRGERILLNLDDFIPYQLFLYGIFYMEHAETMFFRKVVREGMTVLDIGAHIGYYTLQAAVRVKSLGHVHAFEPVSTTFTLLRKNVSMNSLTNVTTNRCAIADHCGRADMFIADNSHTSASSFINIDEFSGRTENVEVLTIDEYINQKRLNKVDLVKIDTEGAELSVLKGMQNLLEKSESGPILLIEVNDRLLRSQNASSEVLYTYLRDHEYQAYKITNSSLIPMEFVQDANMVVFRKQL